MWQKSKKFIYWAAFLFVISLAGVIGREIGGELSKPNKQVDLAKVVTEAASRLNALAPKKVDEITTLVRAEAVNGNQLATYYVLENYDSYAKDFSLVNAKQTVTKNVCDKQKNMAQSPLALGMTHAYIYLREDGTEISRFVVSKKDCS